MQFSIRGNLPIPKYFHTFSYTYINAKDVQNDSRPRPAEMRESKRDRVTRGDARGGRPLAWPGAPQATYTTHERSRPLDW